MSRHEELVKQGRQRRFIAEEPRLSEAVEAYRQLGFEVHLEPVGPEEEMQGECVECLRALAERLRVIYTRRPGGGT
jgi:hypothetical protein